MTDGRAPSTTQRARKTWTCAFVLWLCVIWGHSLMGGDISSWESSRFVFIVRPIFALFGSTDEQLMTFVIRKTAHFSEYAVLAIIARHLWRAWFGEGRRAWGLTALVWVMAPCVDEAIQLLVPGRAGMPTDVALDMLGGIFGMVLLAAYERLFAKS